MNVPVCLKSVDFMYKKGGKRMPLFQEEYFRKQVYPDFPEGLFGFNTHLALKEPAQAVS